ncbi:MAG TPA: hypothetical protein VE860_00990 [Chthoniobacterales bacterium]|jgi:hypothetical protein|nr:hypothetical protein [Chthoniobacterales bacterium]
MLLRTLGSAGINRTPAAFVHMVSRGPIAPVIVLVFILGRPNQPMAASLGFSSVANGGRLLHLAEARHRAQIIIGILPVAPTDKTPCTTSYSYSNSFGPIA